MGEYDLVVGVLLIGLFLNTYLFGLVTSQFITYWSAKFNDPKWIKAVVWSMFCLDLLHSAIAVYSAWETCVTNYANPAHLMLVSWTIPFTASCTAVSALISQIFLCHRVLILTKNKFIAGAIALLSVVATVFGITAGIKSGILGEVVLLGTIKPFVICWLTFQTAADCLITTSLTIALMRSRTGFRATDNIINRLIRGAIQTALFASMFALGDLFSFLFAPSTMFYAMFAYPIGRIYTNTLLDTLNTRIYLKRGTNSNGRVGTDPETQGGSFQFQAYPQSHMLHSIQVQKDVITETHQDEASESASGMDTKYLASDSFFSPK